MPTEQGVCDLIMDAVVDLLTLKLQTEIDADDASRMTTIKVGPRQDDPSAVVVLIHENDPENAREWPHYPMRYPQLQSGGNLTGRISSFGESEAAQLRHTAHYEMVGGGSRMARAFTIEIEVWGDEVPGLTLERRDAGHLASLVENRTIKALREAGAKIDTEAAIVDSFGEQVQMGPFWGDAWTDQEEGEALIVRKYIRLYYATTQAWTTADW